MPESASAVSQITEEEHSWGKQMKGAERKRECEGDGGEAKRELREKAALAQKSVSRWLMSGVSGGRVPGIGAYEDVESCGQGGGQSEHGTR